MVLGPARPDLGPNLLYLASSRGWIFLSSPGPKPQTPKPKTKGPRADTKISWATTHRLWLLHIDSGFTPPITFKHEGGVPQKNSKSKKGLEWSSLLVYQKKFGISPKRTADTKIMWASP